MKQLPAFLAVDALQRVFPTGWVPFLLFHPFHQHPKDVFVLFGIISQAKLRLGAAWYQNQPV